MKQELTNQRQFDTTGSLASEVKLRALAAKMFRTLKYEKASVVVSEYDQKEFGAIESEITPETQEELVENLALVVQRGFDQSYQEQRLASITESGYLIIHLVEDLI